MSTASAEQPQEVTRAAALAARCHGRLDALLKGSGVAGLLLAYSGGLDSTVLLHLLRDYVRARSLHLEACHIDHGLQRDSAHWTIHCGEVAAQLGIAFISVRLSTAPPAGASIEDWARQQRYGALLARVETPSALLTAHHQNDQAETVLLHALRGSGPHGLAGIRAQGRYGDKRLYRPLLDERRADLHVYARVHALRWLEDPSNTEQRFARNRLRSTILPVLEREFPGAAAALAHVATLQGEVVEVLDALTDQILGDEQTLPLCHLRDSAPPLRPYLVKRWLARRGAPPPARPQLASILNEMLSARADGMPVVVWRDVAVRRYDERLFLTAAVLAAAHEQALAWPAPWAPWHFAHGELSAQRRLGEGLDQASLESAPLSVRYRCGGERIQLHHGGPRRALKSLFQEWRVPPWQRPCWPLLYIGDELAVVPGRAVAAEFQVERERPGVVFGWQTRDFPVSD